MAHIAAGIFAKKRSLLRCNLLKTFLPGQKTILTKWKLSAESERPTTKPAFHLERSPSCNWNKFLFNIILFSLFQ